MLFLCSIRARKLRLRLGILLGSERPSWTGPWNPVLPQSVQKDGHPTVLTALTPAPCDKAKAARDGPSATPTPAIINGRREPDFRHNLGQGEVYRHRSTPRTGA